MISDFVKGAQKNSYDWDVRQGILLHRAIDTYTDSHALVAEAKTFFRPKYRLYSGAVVDVLFDHFVANDVNCFSTKDALIKFSQATYQTLEAHLPILPVRFGQMLPYMRDQNWLLDYRSHAGVERSLVRMVRRAAYLDDSHTAYTLLMEHYDALRSLYSAFFPELQASAQQKFRELTS